MRNFVETQELKRKYDNEQYLKDMQRIDEIIAKGEIVTINDLFDQDDLENN